MNREDNIFEGIYGGGLIEFTNGSDSYTAKTKQVIRGFGVRVFVTVENGFWSACYEDTERILDIKAVFKEIAKQD